jgi:thioredoxin-dependent peroxiredoxin
VPEIKPGDKAPDFETTSESGETVRLSDLRGKKVVLYFYPRDDTAGCTTQACGFRDTYASVEEKNAIVLGVSPDDAESHKAFKAKNNLPFPLLIDADHSIAESYGTWQEREREGRKFMGIARSHFVIDEEGTVVDARYNVAPDDSARLSVEALR